MACYIEQKDLAFAKKYVNVKRTPELCETLIRTALGSVADTAIIPMQDYLGLGGEARINTPSTLGGNWEWRMERMRAQKSFRSTCWSWHGFMAEPFVSAAGKNEIESSTGVVEGV